MIICVSMVHYQSCLTQSLSYITNIQYVIVHLELSPISPVGGPQ